MAFSLHKTVVVFKYQSSCGYVYVYFCTHHYECACTLKQSIFGEGVAKRTVSKMELSPVFSLSAEVGELEVKCQVWSICEKHMKMKFFLSIPAKPWTLKHLL